MRDTFQREIWLDWLRVIACFLVMIIHSAEPFYIGGDGLFITNASNLCWVAALDGFARIGVPLFIIASSYLLFPLRYSTKEFVKRRASRLLIPFIIWSLVYACVCGDMANNLISLLFNFNFTAAHLWFIYMIIGLYLLMPVLSPWAEKVGKKELKVYIGIWLFTTLIPVIRDCFTVGELQCIADTTGVPQQAYYPLWGECAWNTNGTFYYISGCVGYLLLGLYLRRFGTAKSWGKTLALSLPLIIVGYALIFASFVAKTLYISGGSFPASGCVADSFWVETLFHNDTIGVAMLTIGVVVLLRKIKASGWLYQHVIVYVSKASYGMYLIHILILLPVFSSLQGWLGTESLGVFTTPVLILLCGVITYCISAIISVALQKIPKVGKWLMG